MSDTQQKNDLMNIKFSNIQFSEARRLKEPEKYAQPDPEKMAPSDAAAWKKFQDMGVDKYVEAFPINKDNPEKAQQRIQVSGTYTQHFKDENKPPREGKFFKASNYGKVEAVTQLLENFAQEGTPKSGNFVMKREESQKLRADGTPFTNDVVVIARTDEQQAKHMESRNTAGKSDPKTATKTNGRKEIGDEVPF